ncbi:hypothetical protein QVD99_005174 [Batrachochytrium dendrobatidis]|nr:hypothetical protein O5D80_007754 [Batrachochytrium dendrobatidis]KAK5668135.1 hypothetical protein QVD99_005174 [Batrachochytrium dendrobatidis]
MENPTLKQSKIRSTVLFILASTATLTNAGITSDPSDVLGLKKTCTGIATNLMSFYKPSYLGTVPESGRADIHGCQWWESGVLWGSMGEYARNTNDDQFNIILTNALSNVSLSNLEVNNFELGTFLGPDQSIGATLLGRWNDDIEWHAMASLTCAQMFGKDALMPRSRTITYLQTAINTYNSVMEQYNDKCGGGIYWSRDRNNGKNKEYKSVITNVQHMVLSSQLTIVTGDKKYVQVAEKIYKWMLKSGLISEKYHVYDGVDASDCSINSKEYSYNSGLLLGGLAYMYKATKNEQYIKDAAKYLPTMLEIYSQDGVLRDLCEDQRGDCQEGDSLSRTPASNQMPYKGGFVRGLTFLYQFTNDQEMKSTLRKVFDKSWEGMMKTCNSEFDCSAWWVDGAPPAKHNFHHQLVAIELSNAMAKVYITPESDTVQFENPTKDFKPPSQSSTSQPKSIYAVTAVVVMATAALSFMLL